MTKYMTLMNTLKINHPDIFEKLYQASLGGFTGSEVMGLIELELKKVKRDQVSPSTYELIQEVIDELRYPY